MIQIDEALAWLNQSPDDPRSHLTNRIRDLIIDIQSNDYPTGEMILLMDRAIIFSEGSLDAYEYPEVLLNCAVIVFKAELYAQARDYVVKAETEYATNLSDTYRRAVSSWVMGLVAWQLNENMIAYENYSATKSAFNEFLEKDLRFLANVPESEIEKALAETRIEKYRSWIARIEVHMAHMAEEAYTWLNAFLSVKPNLSQEAVRLRLGIVNVFNEMQFDVVRDMLRELEDLANRKYNHTETPEILTFTGVIRLRLGDLSEAQKVLRRAVEMYTPGSHQQSVTRWILGITQWDQPETRSLTLKNWESSITAFKQLMDRADIRDDRSAFRWYKSKIPCMEQAFQEKISQV